MIFDIQKPSDIVIETIDNCDCKLLNDKDYFRFFNHEINKEDIIENLQILIEQDLVENKFRDRYSMYGFAIKSNGSKSEISDFEFSCMYSYSIFEKINVVNRIKFIMELFQTSRINVYKMLSGHFFMMNDSGINDYEWYYENYLDIDWIFIEYFKSKYRSFMPYNQPKIR